MDEPRLALRSLIPSFELSAANRDGVFSPWTYKQRYSLVIFLFAPGCSACCCLLRQFSKHYLAYRACDTEILAIAPLTKTLPQDVLDLPFPLLLDPDDQVRLVYLGAAANVGVLVCDRYGELFMQSVASEAAHLPTEPDIRSWAEYVDLQCPECFPPPWR